MTRLLVFLSTFIIVVGAAAVLYVFSGGNVADLRGGDTPAVEAPAPVDAEAVLNEATDYFLGEGVEQSDEKGADLVQIAADAGNHRAIGLLGTLYMGGIGVPQDFDKAKHWLALSNDMEAQELAANLMAFDNIISKLPPEEKERQLAAAQTAAQEQVRASFITALRDLRAKNDAAATEDIAPTGEETLTEDAAPAPMQTEEPAHDSDEAVTPDDADAATETETQSPAAE